MSTTDIETANELIAKSAALIPVLRERASDDEKAGFTSRLTFKDYKEAGLTRIVQPKRYGGFEVPLSVALQVIINLSRGDQSAGWSFAVGQGHAHHLCLFDDRAQADVWGENSEALIASPYNPWGKAATHRDGYMLSGKWPFSSACDHSDWFMLGAFVDEDKSKYLTFLVPRSEVEIIDDWEVFGLKATGSKSVSVKGSFIPAYRTVPFGLGSESYEFPGFKVNGHIPGVRIPYFLVFNRSITATSIGGLAGMIDTVTDYLAPKMSSFSGEAIAKHPDTLLALGEAQATLDELTILAMHDLDLLEAMAKEDRLPDEAGLNTYRYRAQSTGKRAVDSARDLFEQIGGSGLYDKLPIGRIYRNLVGGRNHAAVSMYRDTARMIGADMFAKRSV